MAVIVPAVACVVLVAWVLYSVYIYPFYLSPLRNLPEPDGAGLIWAHAESIRHEHNGAPFRRWTRDIPNQGLIRFRVLFNQERVLVTSPEAIKEILVTNPYAYVKPPQPTFLFRQLLGNGLLVAEGADHKRQRKALLPSFSYRHIKELYPLFWEKATKSAGLISASMQTNPAGPAAPVRVYEWASRVTLDIIGHAAMGYDFDATTNPDGEVVSTYRQLFENEPPHFRWTALGLYLPLETIFKLPIPGIRAARESAQYIRDLGAQVVKSKRAKFDAKQCDDVDILAVAMRSEQFSDDALPEQLMTFLAAGHETTASALTWAIFLLCRHPEVQSQLRQEIRDTIVSPTTTTQDVPPDRIAQLIDSMPYLNAVCNEVLRFMPSVPATVRDAIVDTTIAGVPIPKGTRIFISPWATNINSDYWDSDQYDPQLFKPERWLGPGRANTGGAKTNFASLTFLHGPRSCIGKDFARAEFACLLAAWMHRFEVSWPDQTTALPEDITGWVTIHPQHGLPVRFREV